MLVRLEARGIMIAMPFLLWLALQDPAIEVLVERLRDADPARRDDGSAQIVARWREWKDADLAVLRKRSGDADPELAQRVTSALGRIEMRRRAGRLFEECPEAEPALLRRDPQEMFRLLERLGDLGRVDALAEEELEAWAGLVLENPPFAAAGPWFDLLQTAQPPAYGAFFVRFLDSPDEDLVDRALQALASLKARKQAPAAAKLLSSKSIRLRNAAVASLGQLGDPAFGGPVAALLEDRTLETEDRQAVLWALRRMNARDQADAVARLLGAKDRSLVESALEALGVLGAAGHADAVAAFLREDGFPKAAIGALGLMKSLPHAGLVAPQLKSPDADLRKAAAEALGRMRARDRVADLAALVTDLDERVRHEAGLALLRLGAVSEATRFTNHDERTFRRIFVETLGTTGSPEAAAALTAALGDPEEGVRAAAAEALGRLETDVLSELLKASGSKDSNVRSSATRSLGRLGRSEAVPALLRILAGPRREAHARYNAALALTELEPVVTEPGARAELIAALGSLSKEGGFPPYEQGIARVALAAYGKIQPKDYGGIFDLLETNLKQGGSNWREFAATFADFLLRTHEPELHRKFSARVAHPGVASAADLVRLAEAAGLRLEEAERLILTGDLVPGRLSTRDALEYLLARADTAGVHARRWVLPGKNGLRLARSADVLRYWRKRLGS